MRKFTLPLLAMPVLLFACSKEKTPETSAAAAQSTQEIVTGQSWCIAKGDSEVNDAAEISRMRLSRDGALEFDTVLSLRDEAGLQVYPAIGREKGYQWTLKKEGEKYYAPGVVIELAPFDASTQDWNIAGKLPVELRPRSTPSRQLNLHAVTILGDDKVTSVAYPCTVFAGGVAGAAATGNPLELELRKTLSLPAELPFDWLEGRVRVPRALKYPVAKMSLTEAAVAGKNWCRSEIPFHGERQSGMAKVLQLVPGGAINERRVEGYYDADEHASVLSSRDVTSSLYVGWLMKDGRVELKRAKFSNPSLEKQESDLEAFTGPKIATFYVDTSGLAFLILKYEKLDSLQEDDFYFDCDAYWSEGGKGYRFTDLLWLPRDPLDPFRIGKVERKER